MISKSFFHLRIISGSQRQEAGAMLIMAYLAIVMFLFIAILMLDVPYMERIGRSMQNTMDTAALAGAVQLTLRWKESPTPGVPNFTERLRGWRRSKRAVFAALKLNPIMGAESLVFDTTNPVMANQDSLDLSSYGYERYNISGGGLNADLTITRGVYHRPNNFGSDAITTFYRVERDNTGTVWADDGMSPPIEIIRCIARTSPDTPKHEFPVGTVHDNEPTECLSDPSDSSSLPGNGQPVVSVADSMQVSLTVHNVPTLFAKLIGINSFVALTRTAVSVPE